MTPGNLEKVAFFHRGSDLEIVRRWFEEGRTIPSTLWVVIFNAFISFLFFNMSARVAMPSSMDDISLIEVVPLIFLAAGIFWAYTVAAAWLNRTSIVVNRETLSVRHGPLPWPGNKMVAVAEIRQLHAMRSRWVSGNRMNRKYRFDLHADKQDAGSIRLAGGFETEDQALRVKQEIEKYLSLKPVQPKPQVALGLGTGGTNIQSVLGGWLFILVWNGFMWWVVWMIAARPGTKNFWMKIAAVSPFLLIGLGLIYLAIPPTVEYFRRKSTAHPDPAPRNSGWGLVISMMVIAGGFVLILMQAPKAPDRTPLTDIQVREAQEQHKAQWIREYRTQMGEPQPVAFFEGTWRRHGRLYQDDVRRVSIRSNGGGLSMGVWYDCIYGGPACDAGEVPAVLTARPDGLIESLSAKLPVPQKSIWLWMSSGKYSYQPAVIGTSINGTLGILVRENPAAPLAQYVGEWGRPAPKEIGDFTRLTVRQTGTQALAIHVWALCADGRECDLGEKPAQMELEADGLLREAKVVFETKYGELTIILEPPYQGRFDAHGILHRESKSTSSTSTVRVALTRGHP